MEKEESQVADQRRRAPVLSTPEIKLKTTLTPFYLLENTATKANFGSNMSVLSQLPKGISSPSRKSWIKSYKNVKFVRQVSALSEKNFTLRPSMNWSEKWPSTAQREASFWSEWETRSKWLSKPIKLYMKVPLLTAWGKRFKMSSKEPINSLDKRV